MNSRPSNFYDAFPSLSSGIGVDGLGLRQFESSLDRIVSGRTSQDWPESETHTPATYNSRFQFFNSKRTSTINEVSANDIASREDSLVKAWRTVSEIDALLGSDFRPSMAPCDEDRPSVDSVDVKRLNTELEAALNVSLTFKERLRDSMRVSEATSRRFIVLQQPLAAASSTGAAAAATGGFVQVTAAGGAAAAAAVASAAVLAGGLGSSVSAPAPPQATTPGLITSLTVAAAAAVAGASSQSSSAYGSGSAPPSCGGAGVTGTGAGLGATSQLATGAGGGGAIASTAGGVVSAGGAPSAVQGGGLGAIQHQTHHHHHHHNHLLHGHGQSQPQPLGQAHGHDHPQLVHLSGGHLGQEVVASPEPLLPPGRGIFPHRRISTDGPFTSITTTQPFAPHPSPHPHPHSHSHSHSSPLMSPRLAAAPTGLGAPLSASAVTAAASSGIMGGGSGGLPPAPVSAGEAAATSAVAAVTAALAGTSLATGAGGGGQSTAGLGQGPGAGVGSATPKGPGSSYFSHSVVAAGPVPSAPMSPRAAPLPPPSPQAAAAATAAATSVPSTAAAAAPPPYRRFGGGIRVVVGSALDHGVWDSEGAWRPADPVHEVYIPQHLQRINPDDLVKVRELGRGCFGSVWLARWRGVEVALKELLNQRSLDGPPNEVFYEAERLASLRHPCVIAFYGIVTTPGSYSTVVEYMRMGSLKSGLSRLRKQGADISHRLRVAIALQAARGMEYLHGQYVVHFDLKCENLLCDLRDPARPVVKIGDLGLSKKKKDSFVSGNMRGTLPWMAPELFPGVRERQRQEAAAAAGAGIGEVGAATDGGSGLLSNGMGPVAPSGTTENGSEAVDDRVNEKVDVFSFGIVLWEIWQLGEQPYSSMSLADIFAGVLTGSLRPAVPADCDPGWVALMQACWHGNPRARPSFSEIADQLDALLQHTTQQEGMTSGGGLGSGAAAAAAEGGTAAGPGAGAGMGVSRRF